MAQDSDRKYNAGSDLTGPFFGVASVTTFMFAAQKSAMDVLEISAGSIETVARKGIQDPAQMQNEEERERQNKQEVQLQKEPMAKKPDKEATSTDSVEEKESEVIDFVKKEPLLPVLNDDTPQETGVMMKNLLQELKEKFTRGRHGDETIFDEDKIFEDDPEGPELLLLDELLEKNKEQESRVFSGLEALRSKVDEMKKEVQIESEQVPAEGIEKEFTEVEPTSEEKYEDPEEVTDALDFLNEISPVNPETLPGDDVDSGIDDVLALLDSLNLDDHPTAQLLER